ncbi:NAC domain-containing protein 90-like [Cynara cardunculus var. scolymus]|uniref:No apical meristem (NAM) protein n=1 Tax=Cynara cardunculus var. scolymus TaxID=59895 RepID=A0A103Y6Q5_CYNCS|nr:NAC domain-containing protein 90-like [Cynara cardunculus var. scolymus]KVI03524.1 No apical meristem (NAM) protein [Cynara cardunculus var. scolymus]
MEGGMVTPGFRFYPTEEELITFYLKHTIEGTPRLLQAINRVIPHLHVYDFYPWDLPQYAGELCKGDPEQWFFFIPRQEKETRGGRTSRLTKSGYWKATGSPSVVYSSGNRRIAIKRTMVFYNGRAPTGKKTKWKMNEYKAFQEEVSSTTKPKIKLMQELSICRVYIKSNCLRAFDRRPSGVVVTEPRPIQQSLHNNDHHATTLTYSNHRAAIERTICSSDNNYNSSQDHTSSSGLMREFDDQPLWDWEEHYYSLL